MTKAAGPEVAWRLSGYGVSDGARTRDILDHNQVLYLLSYAHHAFVPAKSPEPVVGAPSGTRTPNPLIKSQLLCQLS